MCQKRQPGTSQSSKDVPYNLRQLPIHIAVWNLDRFSATAQTKEVLNQLITNLVVAHPESCKLPDHSGKLPLHMAISNGAQPETISILLMAYPESVDSQDIHGRSMSHLNDLRTDEAKTQIGEILTLGVDFWTQAHNEAVNRLKHANPAIAADKSIESTSVLASSRVEEETLLSDPERNCDPRPVDTTESSDEIQPMAWEQLEERALALEEILTEMNERNYVLTMRLNAVAKSKEELLKKLDQVHGGGLISDIEKLETSNIELKAKVVRMEKLIRNTVLQINSTDGRKRRRHEPISTQKVDSKGPTEMDERATAKELVKRVETLHQDYETLASKYDARLDQINRLETIIDTLTESAADYDGKGYKETLLQQQKRQYHSSNSVFSDLSAPSERILLERQAAKSAIQSHPVFDITWVPPQILVAESDDLAVILHEAAVRESTNISARGARSVGLAEKKKTDTSSDQPIKPKASTPKHTKPIDVLPSSSHDSVSSKIAIGSEGSAFSPATSLRSTRTIDSVEESSSEEEDGVTYDDFDPDAYDNDDYMDDTIAGSSMHLSMNESIVSGGFCGQDEHELEIPALHSGRQYEPLNQIHLSRIGFVEDSSEDDNTRRSVKTGVGTQDSRDDIDSSHGL